MSTAWMMDRVGSVTLTRGDRLIAESGAKIGEHAAALLCRAASSVRSALARTKRGLLRFAGRGNPALRDHAVVCVVLICALAASLGPLRSSGQTWPQRPVKVIVPFGAGGSTDAQARIVSERLATVLGQPVVVEDHPGASGAIAAELVARAPADGQTLFFSAVTQVSVLPLVQNIRYDPVKDFTPVSIVGTNPFVLGVPVKLPARTLGEFIAYVKARPGKLNYVSPGAGTLIHLASVEFLARAGLQMTHVPYKDSSQMFTGISGGEIQMLFGTPSDMIRFSKAGKVRLLAVSGERRASQFPDLPPLADFYPGFRIVSWNGFLAPAGTPGTIIGRLAHEIAKVVHEPATAAKLAAIGVDALGNTPAEFREMIRGEAPMWRNAVAAAGIRPE